MQDSALLREKNSSFSGKGLFVELFCILLAVTVLGAHYLLFTAYETQTTYFEPITSSQFLLRSSKTDELLLTLSLTSLVQVDNQKQVPIWDNAADISVSETKYNYLSFTVVPTAFVIRGKDTKTTSTLIATQKQDTVDLHYFLETADSYKKDEKPKVLVLPIDQLEKFTIATVGKDIILSKNKCQLVFKVEEGKFTATDKDKEALVFQFAGSKLHIVTTYACATL